MEGEDLTQRLLDRAAIEQFLYREARLADEHRYDEWESLWADQALYWVPIDDAEDPETHVSVIFDNRARLGSRIRQLKTGRRHSQAPQSSLRRVISNIEIAERDGDVITTSNFVLLESRRETLVTWAGQAEHRLQSAKGEFRIASKIVRLINSKEPITNLAFLI